MVFLLCVSWYVFSKYRNVRFHKNRIHIYKVWHYYVHCLCVLLIDWYIWCDNHRIYKIIVSPQYGVAYVASENMHADICCYIECTEMVFLLCELEGEFSIYLVHHTDYHKSGICDVFLTLISPNLSLEHHHCRSSWWFWESINGCFTDICGCL